MSTIPEVVLSAPLYDELRALVQWQFDAPVSIERCFDDLVEVEASIWDRAGYPGLWASFAEIDGGLVAEDENDVVYQVVRGV